MIPEPPQTPVPRAGVCVFQARLFQEDLYVVDDGGEVSLVNRERLLMLLEQLFVKETNHD